jgi:hypothetical protein
MANGSPMHHRDAAVMTLKLSENFSRRTSTTTACLRKQVTYVTKYLYQENGWRKL